MEDAILEIVATIKAGVQTLDAEWLEKLVRRHNRKAHDARRTVAKRRLLPFYLQVRENEPERWQAWDVDQDTEAQLLRILKMKPRRTASGVATITVITKPWPCSSDCLYCPNDIRMPKSYLHDEPACQRAEHNFFDPYLQVKSRLYALQQMGHITDKVELIVLGGTWNDYPKAYQRWFVRELFRALNDETSYHGGPELGGSPCASVALPTDADRSHDDAPTRTSFYQACGLTTDRELLEHQSVAEQEQVNHGSLTYNQAVQALLRRDAWSRAAAMQVASWEDVESQHRLNESGSHRVVGLVIETRPDLITPDSACTMRRLGCTKIQMGIQSLDDEVLRQNRRHVTAAQVARAFLLLRAYGFKLHVHFMCNLLGMTPDADRADYLRLVRDARYLPDEVKLYPCALVESSHLMAPYQDGTWRPYTEDELVGLLVDDVLATPAYTRISRMIRDISASDIVAGNKKTNLRQMVETCLASRRSEVREIRMREIATDDVTLADLHLDCVSYATESTHEHFLQWVTDDGRIAGFCRLSLPNEQVTAEAFGNANLPTEPGTAMIREVHVYGRVASLGATAQGAAQHAGLGKALVEEACRRASYAGYQRVAVISAIGTRGYYRSLGFSDHGLYQLRVL